MDARTSKTVTAAVSGVIFLSVAAVMARFLGVDEPAAVVILTLCMAICGEVRIMLHLLTLIFSH